MPIVTLVSDYAGQGTDGAGASVFRPGGSSDTGALRVAKKGKVLYDSGTVAAGAVINSPVLDLTGIESVSVIAANATGGSARSLSMTVYLDDGTTQIASFGVATVNGNDTAKITVAPDVTQFGPSVTSFSMVVPTKAKFALAAAGAADARVTVIGR
jgi:hypothetical protein